MIVRIVMYARLEGWYLVLSYETISYALAGANLGRAICPLESILENL